MVISGEMTENTIKSHRLSLGESFESVKKSMNKDKEKKVNVVSESHARFNQNPYLAQAMYLLNMLNSIFNPYSPAPQPALAIEFAPKMSFALNLI